MTEHPDSPQSKRPSSPADSAAMEWLYDTLDQEPETGDERRLGRPFPIWTALFLLAGLILVAGLIWLLIGPPVAREAELAQRTPTRVILPLVEAGSPSDRLPFSPLTTPTSTPAPATAFEVGDRVTVINTEERGLRFRTGAGLDYITQEIYHDGDAFFVMPNSDSAAPYPVEIDGYTWWRLRAPDGLIGWAAEDFLTPAPLLAATPTPGE